MKRAAVAALVALGAAGCVEIRPMHINSDPNQEALERMEEKTEAQNVEAFIVDHPELDAGTKKELRDGTISRHEALERQKSRR